MLSERLPAVRVRSGAVILLCGPFAYKWFVGAGAQARYREEYTTFCRARNCQVWGPHLLPLHLTCIPNMLRSRRGSAVNDHNGGAPELSRFIEQRLTTAAGSRILRPVPQLLERPKLRIALGEGAFASIEPLIDELLCSAQLPVGPTHGDLHRGNILVVDGRHFVIDCNRFNPTSAPLFDKLHFRLNERRREQRRAWVDLLDESQDIVIQAMADDKIDGVSAAQAALAYGLNRIAYEGYDARLRGRSRPKYWEFATHLLRKYGGCDARFLPDGLTAGALA